MSISVRGRNSMHAGRVELVWFKMWKKLTRPEHRQQTKMVGEATKREAMATDVNSVLEHIKDG